MKKNIAESRKKCAAVLAKFYSKFGLLADMLGKDGEYRSFWQTPNGTVLEAKSNNIFDEQAFTYVYELKYTTPRSGRPIAS